MRRLLCALDRRPRLGRERCRAPVHRTGSPDLAAQPGGGHREVRAGRPRRTITASDGLPRRGGLQLVDRARASAAESSPATSVDFEALRLAASSPTRITCAPPASLGAASARAARARPRSPSGSSPSLGEQDGRAQRRRHRAARRRSPRASRRTSTSDDRGGRVSPGARGIDGRATPAASATGSAPPTRVVFLVAKTGKPSAGRRPSSPPGRRCRGPGGAARHGVGRRAVAAAAAAGEQEQRGEQSRMRAAGHRRRTLAGRLAERGSRCLGARR